MASRAAGSPEARRLARRAPYLCRSAIGSEAVLAQWRSARLLQRGTSESPLARPRSHTRLKDGKRHKCVPRTRERVGLTQCRCSHGWRRCMSRPLRVGRYARLVEHNTSTPPHRPPRRIPRPSGAGYSRRIPAAR
ncbi:hypothetical protein B0H10DRAFT_1316395 [Mycena sp. CBHHK59/15]|nr:hypothetical protein B0H10DRAFT_1316395 [Mycena sp. CBHHK59/15]